jgi:hypothetical protein
MKETESNVCAGKTPVVWRPSHTTRTFTVYPSGEIYSDAWVSRRGWKYDSKKLKFSDIDNGRDHVSICGKFMGPHRIVAECFIPKPKGKDFVDHIDGNPKNHDSSNLRWVTRSENQRAFMSRCSKFSSRYRGVSRNKQSNKWRAKFNHNGKTEHLGLFEYEITAALAYNRRAIEAGYMTEAMNLVY